MQKIIFLIFLSIPYVISPMFSSLYDHEHSSKKNERLETHTRYAGTITFTPHEIKEAKQENIKRNKKLWLHIIQHLKPDFNADKHTITYYCWGMTRWYESLGFLARKAGNIDLKDSHWFEERLQCYVPDIKANNDGIEIDFNHMEISFFKSLPWIHQHPLKLALCAIGITALSAGLIGYQLGSRLGR